MAFSAKLKYKNVEPVSGPIYTPPMGSFWGHYSRRLGASLILVSYPASENT
ncbi:unnamed protein product [Acanthoscelides obtectus]|uniref:Uncharacterized protein n=1 Tax=Acanthoscelides obtectus TaxID=200917 RepID=A0A9P0KIK5_ACAOB|nr:unnamed protein product [Acanthoscelides obtectus]CAK1668757.1 hypothetical protein AOBTE_LOCUS26587 [Acanthoscelides obtectus]